MLLVDLSRGEKDNKGDRSHGQWKPIFKVEVDVRHMPVCLAYSSIMLNPLYGFFLVYVRAVGWWLVGVLSGRGLLMKEQNPQ